MKKWKNKMSIKYMAKNKGYIRIFGDKFVENNKKYCKIKYKGKKNKLKSFINYKESNTNDIIEIKIKFYGEIINMSNMFYNCENLLSFSDILKRNINKISDMSYMFYNCKSLKSLPDISKWNINSISDLSYMFYNCESL